jgi:hypothetical protein
MRRIRPVAPVASLAMVLFVAGCGAAPVPSTTTPPASATDIPATVAPTPSGPTATPAPTFTQAPTPDATFCCPIESPPLPSPSPAAAATPGTPSVIGLDEARIAEHLDALQQIAGDNNGSRAVGTSGYEASADYVEEQLLEMGYTVERNPVDFTSFAEVSPTTITIGQQTWSSPEWLQPMIYSASGDVAALAQTVGVENGSPTANGACDSGAWADFEAGNIALVMGDPCIRRDLVPLATGAGATALISLVPQWSANHVLQPTLIDPAGIDIPVIGAGLEPSAALLTAAGDGTLVKVHTEVTRDPATVDNVCGEIPGSDDVVMLGGHLDSVLAGPGINDNGSGVATLLAMADEVANGPAPQATIRFCFWAAEEFGDIGSRQYVDALTDEERLRIRAYFNLDMVASPNAGLFVYDDPGNSAGSHALSQQLIDALAARGFPSFRTDTGGASDHFAFEQAGVPVGGLFSGISPLSAEEAQLFGGVAGQPADACYHLSCDTRANTDTATAVILGTAIADVVAGMAY